MSALLKVTLVAPLIGLSLFLLNLAGPVHRAHAPASHLPDRWWPTYGGSLANTRHADLHDIAPANVGSLKLAWKFNTGISGAFEATPIAVDGVVYVTTGRDNGVFAVDAASGKLKWHYVPRVSSAPYIFSVNRGVAVAGGRVFITTLDAHIIALDAQTGKALWNTRIGDPHDGLSETAAPLAWNGLVFIGSSGNEFGVRGSFSAYSQRDGTLKWRWWTVSRGWEGRYAAAAHGLPLHRNIRAERASARHLSEAWKHGGGAVWMTPALNAREATIYLSTGNPAPAFRGDRRPGDNLYTDSIVALDARSGTLKWYYQETPHDVWDFDASSPPVLFDTHDAAGTVVPAVGEAGKTGLLYILDRRNGRLIRISDSFTAQTLRYDPPSAGGQKLDFGGALGPVAFDRATQSVYVDATIQPQTLRTSATPLQPWSPGSVEWTGGGSEDTQIGSDALSAIDVNSGRRRWSTSVPSVDFSGILSTPGLVFLGEQYTGVFRAYDAATGKVLWQVRPAEELATPFDLRDAGGQFIYATRTKATHFWHRVRHIAESPIGSGSASINSPAVAYRYNGREYILIGSNVFEQFTHRGGDTLFAFALP